MMLNKLTGDASPDKIVFEARMSLELIMFSRVEFTPSFVYFHSGNLSIYEGYRIFTLWNSSLKYSIHYYIIFLNKAIKRAIIK